ncbi:MAG: hypothetical protein ABSA63_06000, partial [Thermoplasmata archaeon]
MSQMIERSGPAPRPTLALAAALLALSVALLGAGMITVIPAAAAGPTSPALAPEFVNISATSSFNFVPNSFSVQPGATVHLIVTQMADFDHTFTLSSVVNATIPSSDDHAQVAAFFNSHAPIVNLSLGSTVGHPSFANFTAPTTLGAYEWICLIHFPTMTGIMSVSNSPPSSGSGSSPTTLEFVEIGAAVGVVVIAIGLVAWGRARRRA